MNIFDELGDGTTRMINCASFDTNLNSIETSKTTLSTFLKISILTIYTFYNILFGSLDSIFIRIYICS